MLSQKPKIPAQVIQPTKSKCSKPYSLLSIGLSKLPGFQFNVRNWQKNEGKIPSKVKELKQNNENCLNLTGSNLNSIREQQRGEKNLPLVKSQINLPTFQRLDYQKGNIVKEDIIFSNQKVTFQNITNQMIEESTDKLDSFEKQNINTNNDVKDCISVDKCEPLVVNLKKKIKKVQRNTKFVMKSKHSLHLLGETQIQNNQTLQILNERQMLAQAHSEYLQNPCSDFQVFPDSSVFRNQIINQRLDNDVQSDDEQVQAGINRLHRFLSDHVKQNLQGARGAEY